MKILVLLTGEFGGTDLLLKRYSDWLKINKSDFVIEVTFINDLKMSKFLNFDLVVLPTSQIDNLIRLKKYNIEFDRILIWCMGHGAFSAAYYNTTKANPSYLYKLYSSFSGYMSKLSIRHFININSCIFTDEVGMNFDIGNININKEENLVFPVPIKIRSDLLARFEKKKEQNNIRLCWLGRISKDFKINSLIGIIDDIEENIKSGIITERIVFTIVGEGDGVELLQSKISNNKLNNLEYNYINHVNYEEISEFLALNADFLFAMGTSALDGARIGCPTIIVKPYGLTEIIQKRKYRWVFESKGYSLGEFNSFDIKPVQIQSDFKQIYIDMKSRNDLSIKSYKYAKHFDESIVFKHLRDRELPHKLRFTSYVIISYLYILKLSKAMLKRLLI